MTCDLLLTLIVIYLFIDQLKKSESIDSGLLEPNKIIKEWITCYTSTTTIANIAENLSPTLRRNKWKSFQNCVLTNLDL